MGASEQEHELVRETYLLLKGKRKGRKNDRTNKNH